jgi:hypothetical protein
LVSTEAAQILRNAQAYPFTVPARPSIFVGQTLLPVAELAPRWEECAVEVEGRVMGLGACCRDRGVPLAGGDEDSRIPVLAHGSNASPEALSRKFGQCDPPTVIPVLHATLHDLDVVYSAHLSRYGSVPSTLQYSPGTTITVPYLYLTSSQLTLLHDTERNYHFGHLTGIRLETEDGRVLREVASYVSRHGCLRAGDTETGLAVVRRRNGRFPTLTEPEMLSHARDRLSPGQDMVEFVAQTVADDRVRDARTAALRETAIPFAWPGWDPPD